MHIAIFRIQVTIFSEFNPLRDPIQIACYVTHPLPGVSAPTPSNHEKKIHHLNTVADCAFFRICFRHQV